MEITRVNPFTGELHTRDLDLTKEQYDEIISDNGRLVQVIAPHLCADDREFIITGMLPKDFDFITT